MEVVLAIGVVSFAMMAVLGALPVGLKSSQESRGQVATANIARQLQGELQQISFIPGNDADVVNIGNLGNKSFFFSLEGTRTDKDSKAAYYEATFDVSGDIELPGGAKIDGANARSVKVTLAYPTTAQAKDRQKAIFTLLLAKQNTN